MGNVTENNSTRNRRLNLAKDSKNTQDVLWLMILLNIW